MLIPLTFYWFSFRPIINITFSFTNNYSLYQQFIKKNVSLSLFIFYYSIQQFKIILASKHTLRDNKNCMRAFPWLTFWDLIFFFCFCFFDMWDLICSHMLLEKIKYDFEFMSFLYISMVSILLFKRFSLFGFLIFLVQKCPYTPMFK